MRYLKEHRDEFPGVEIVDTYLRNYPYRTLAAQVLGYVGEISREELKRLGRTGYRGGDEDRQERCRGRVRHVPARDRRARAARGSTRSESRRARSSPAAPRRRARRSG